MMKVSIAMATYNGAKYIEEQLQSFLIQTRQPDEIIITDDCSVDETETIVREFSKMSPFKVEFYRNEKNLGYCGNFNAALMKTTGDLVFLSDQDDFWLPGKIEHMLGVAEKNPQALVLMNNAALTDEDLNDVGLTKLGQIKSAGLGIDSFVMGCCCAVHRKLLEFAMPIPDGVRGHDNWLVDLADGLSAKVVDPTVLQYYRRHEFNESKFIANRTKKVTRLSVYLQSFKKLRHHNIENELTLQLAEFKGLLEGVNAARVRAPAPYNLGLGHIEEHYKIGAETTEKRLAVAKMPLFNRLAVVGEMLLNGRYRYANGILSAIRDILA